MELSLTLLTLMSLTVMLTTYNVSLTLYWCHHCLVVQLLFKLCHESRHLMTYNDPRKHPLPINNP